MGKLCFLNKNKQIKHSTESQVFGGTVENFTLFNNEGKTLINTAGNWASAMVLNLALGYDFELSHIITEENWNANSIRCMIGITNKSTPNTTYPTYTTLRNAIYVESKTSVEIYENSNWIMQFDTPVNVGDIFTVKSSNGRISYLKNGIVFHTTTQGPIGEGWYPTVCGGDLGKYNIFGGDKYNITEVGAVGNQNLNQLFKEFTKINVPIQTPETKFLIGTSGYKYSKNLDLNGLKLNGQNVGYVARKGYRPVWFNGGISLNVRSGAYKIIKEADGTLKINDIIVATADADVHSFNIMLYGGGGSGGSNKKAIIGSGWSGAGGGSGAFVYANITLPHDFVGCAYRIDVVSSENGGGYVYINWRDTSGDYLCAGQGIKGGNGCSGCSGAGVGGIIDIGGNWSTLTANEFVLVQQANGIRGKNTKPSDDGFNANSPITTLNNYFPDLTGTITLGGYACGEDGQHGNRGGPGAGGYCGKGGHAGYNGSSRGYPGEKTAGGGGADAAGNTSFSGGAGGDAFITIQY